MAKEESPEEVEEEVAEEVEETAEQEESSEPVEAEAEAAPPEKKKKDPAAKWTQRILIACVFMFVWYLIGDRYTPYTSQGRVRGFVVEITPQVSGIISEVNVDLNERVEKDQVLVQIQKSDYELAVREAEAALEQAGQDVGANTADVSSATAQVVEAKAKLDLDRSQLDRISRAVKTGAVSQSEADTAQAQVELSVAKLRNAEGALEEAKQRMGAAGQDNSKIKSAQAALADAQLDLSRTTLLAPGDGGVTNARIEAGQYASAGQPLMNFLSTRTVWVEAYLRENSLGRIAEGNKVDIVLDVAPGRIFEGTVGSVGFGVEWGDVDDPSNLPKISAPRDWLRDPQRFPVVIHFTDPDALIGLRREGGQADVIVYNTENPILKGLARFWIRLVSWFTYVS